MTITGGGKIYKKTCDDYPESWARYSTIIEKTPQKSVFSLKFKITKTSGSDMGCTTLAIIPLANYEKFS